MNYKLSKLKNGLRVLTVPLPKIESATLTVWVGVGSRSESDKISGLSHFLEHMVFKGSQKRPTAREISEVVDAIGGEFNAGTSKEWTNFYIKARSANLETAFDILSDMVLRPLLVPAEIEKEKGVILEEKKMYEDNPVMIIGEVFERLMFKGTDLGRDVIGTDKSIKGIKKQDFEQYRKIHYFADNIILTVSGGISEKNTLELADKYFGDLKSSILNRKSTSKISKLEQKTPRVLLQTKKGEQANLILGFPGNPMNHPDRFIEAILATILGGGMSSRLFIEVRERRGLAYSVRTSPEHYIDTGYFSTYAGVDVTKVDEAIGVMLEEHYKISSQKSVVSSQELRKAKEYIKGHLALSLEDTRSVNGFFGERELLLGKVETPEEVYQKIDAVTTDQVVAVAKKLFVPGGLNLAIIGPYKDQARFEKLLQ